MPPGLTPVNRRDLAGINMQDFALRYRGITGADFTRDILTTEIPFEFISPRHELQDVWNSPAFFADSRNAFLVRSAEQPGWIRTFQDYGILVNSGVLQAAQIPPLVMQPPPPPKPRFWADGSPFGSDRSVVDPASMQRFVTEDAYIRQGLGTTLNIKYGDREIGPSGAVSNGTTRE